MNLNMRKLELFGSYFLKLFLIIVFENIKNVILMFFENCFCYLNLVFSVFFLFFIINFFFETKLIFCIFLILLVFHNKKTNNNKQ